ncbi:MAG: LamG-like jellyroll fold domain-containing protein [Pseudomonadota bacterium]
MQNLRRKSLALGLLICCAGAYAAGYTPDTREFPASAPLAFPEHPLLELRDGGAIEFWVAADWRASPGYHPVILAYGPAAAPQYSLAITAQRDALLVQAGEQYGQFAFRFDDGRTHHVALLDFDDEIMVLIDGQFVGGVSMSFAGGEPGPLVVGARADGSDAFVGALSALRLWDMPMAPETVPEFALRDPLAVDRPHPNIEHLVAYSDFRSGELVLAEALILEEEMILSDAEILETLGAAEVRSIEQEFSDDE